jgi:hypothetical protein
MNADRVAESPAMRARDDPSVLGTIIINLQQYFPSSPFSSFFLVVSKLLSRTRLDGISSLRIWGKLDEVFSVSLHCSFFAIFFLFFLLQK